MLERYFTSAYFLEAYIDEEAVFDAVKHSGMFTIIQTESITKIDFIVQKNTQYRKAEFSRRVEVEIAKHRVSLVSAEDLLLSKLVWAKDSQSEMQLYDVENLIASTIDLDWVYSKHWSSILFVSDTLDSLSDVPK